MKFLIIATVAILTSAASSAEVSERGDFHFSRLIITVNNAWNNNASHSGIATSGWRLVPNDSFVVVNTQNVSNRVSLNWETAGDTEKGVYTIERSEDGVSFSPIGSVNAGRGSAYFYEDNNPLNGKNFYRILFSDNNHIKVYSKIITTTFTSGDALKAYYISGGRIRITVNVNVTGVFQIAVVNYMGQPVYKGEFNNDGVKNTFDITTDGRLNQGIYAIMISNREVRISKQILVR